MNKLKRACTTVARKAFDLVMGNGLMQEENTAEGDRYITPGMGALIRAMGAEGAVLLKNEENTLPLSSDTPVSVFGRCQNDWFYVGYGSGGDVHPPYRVNLMEGLANAGIPVVEELAQRYAQWCAHPDNAADHGWWGHWPYFHEEMELEEKWVQQAARESDTALIVIGRAAGEDRENRLEPGSYYLTQKEKDMLRLVSKYYKKTVLILNTGNIMDMSFIAQYRIAAALIVWQPGQESGNAVADILCGRANPSGKLSDTIAKAYEDYPSSANFGNRAFNNYQEDIFVGYRYFDTFCPEKILYPFGYGLSYTTFRMDPISSHREADATVLNIRITNTGSVAGKEVAQIYCAGPEGLLSRPKKVLVAFEKTKTLLPGEYQDLTLSVRDYDCASFDDSGCTGHSNAFVMEKGIYRLIAGNSSAADTVAAEFEIPETRNLCQCRNICPPRERFSVLHNRGETTIHAGSLNLKQRILEELPKEIPCTGDQGILLADVVSGKRTLNDFIAQLTDRELGDLTRGEGGMGSKLGITGNAGAFGGITPQLRSRGIPALITADGPAGLRIRRFTSLLPCGTAIACSWNRDLTEALFQKVGEEAAHFGVDVILSPGMNIHRNPLCGRNFEYYSEDPLLCGKTAAAAVRGIQKGGTSACPKHFACNNQEVNRNHNDSRLSHRALREIYLKCFEICIKEGNPQNLMTSYNKINGIWAHYHYDLVTTVLRQEWGYRGNVMTDWWMRMAKSPEFPKLRNNAYRVRAQVDVLMPGSLTPGLRAYVFDRDQLSTLGQEGGLTRAELQRSAMNVLRFAMLRLEAQKKD